MKAHKFFLYCSIFLMLASNSVLGRSISGFVFQLDGQPIPGATVELTRLDKEGWWETTTESDGSYRIKIIEQRGEVSGDYKIRAFKSGFAREYYDNIMYSNEATIIPIPSAGNILGIDFYLTEGGSISGYVYNNETGEPIEGVEIRVVPSSEELDDGFHATTDSSGSYTVECLPLGAYEVKANAPGFIGLWYEHDYDADFATDVKVIPPDDTPNINFSLSRGGSISGFAIDVNGIPVESAEVRAVAQLPDGDWIGRGEETDSNGRYVISDLPAWDYYMVSVRKTGFATEWYDSKITETFTDNVIVTEGNDTSGINFTLDIGGSITGHVYDEDDGTPISGIEFIGMLSTGEGLDVLGHTVYDGSYTIWLRTGNYLISANSSARGYG